MVKLNSEQKQQTKCGFGIGALIFGIVSITLGVSGVIGSAVTGAKNIEQAKATAPAKILTNSVFSNTYKTNMF